ncbi:rhodanese-like domain-containing protein [Thiorhodococcus minor]|uniref:Rhodanese-like domain-containing protein n=1 Tax=Thiorhodococcus minor TaxID=57489 RepID=A0A6M0JZH6_9GAMM|nr:rhodanese-like domain-containing protein [Thiorhodococcus minor]NEV62938.1 rhodanese-like domain-containing protein [Thiorhodococcus minor]
MTQRATSKILLALVAAFALPLGASATENKIARNLESVEVMHDGKPVTVYRGHDRDAKLPEIFQKTDRGCPPFCVQPIIIADGVETIGELELLGYLKRMAQGEDDLMVIDSRTPDWVMRGTIPGSVNIPWNKINRETAGTFETPSEADSFHHILEDELGVDKKPDGAGWDFSRAKTLVLFCNGIWCPQSSMNIHTLIGIGYPVHKLKWYRGGMQDWVSVGLTIVKP